ncbi:YjeF N-terminal domain-containing protein NAXE-like protein [Aduncisulcus paluster]|uniref:NAD(P)H-hydrate epimerase n=1 Tax=Aduncisulcus paluster TaxID=2918883 RepID=A0ABQ5JRS3_9EUKA|nr:YjeF N-terminal domain-containing protein NAXE-like protein [Aduncisulcus paluster]|eukprot:gnl/Carplike_NY0171/7265_a10030_210.p1 GENE.gnl/Carplike_NY0171/7265_a10030_210~~gnl/Carplike_NY0171/7265_a10030_210.p1  ORF type:complete len:245 (+),score=58.08 gnl/Carplike_NY0171/7265_a10030_210:111-845(+)
MRYLSGKEAYDLDQQLFSTFQYSVVQLVELAGLSVALCINDVLARIGGDKTALVLCGPGNNGADGIVAARHLALHGWEVDLCITKKSSKSDIADSLIAQAVSCGAHLVDLDSLVFGDSISKEGSSLSYNIIVDSIFGFSFDSSRPLRAPFDLCLPGLAKASKSSHVVCVDIPSGWNVSSEKQDPDKELIVPSTLISLTTPKTCALGLPKSTFHYVSGRFIPIELIKRLEIDIPYEGADLFVKIQ